MFDCLKSMLVAPLVAASLSTSGIAAPAKSAPPASDCIGAHTLLTALTTAGDWIIKRDPVGVTDEKITGLVFREGGMINVALFQDGCLAMVVVVGKAPPDIKA